MILSLFRHDRTEALVLPIETIEGREWWLWAFATVVTVALTIAIVALVYPGLSLPAAREWSDLRDWVRGLAALVLLFDLYTVYQHLQLTRMRRQLSQRNRLFQLITENAADMIAVVDMEGRRIYNSPSYQSVLGYTSEELTATRGLDQIHPDDRGRVVVAAERAKLTGKGERLEYRIRHKDGSWRIFESTANAIRNAKSEIESLVIVNRDITDRKRAEELLEYNALHDRLTHLPNRTLFLRQLERAIAFSRRHGDYTFAVLFFDIDGFKLINESLGYEAGDELLVDLGMRLKTSVRGLDTIARPTLQSEPPIPAEENKDGNLAKLGGDEYAILLDDIRHPTDAVRVATRLQGVLGTPFQIGTNEVSISVSVGIALNQASYVSPQDLLRDSEIAMHRAKLAGKSRCQVFDVAMHAQAVKRLETEAEIRSGIADNEFKVYYQPIVSLKNGSIVGLEALSRWQKGDHLVLPGEFIEIADETGLIIPINRQLLLESCQRLKRWQGEYPQRSLFLSINIPPRQFVDPNLIDGITSVLEQTDFDRDALELEIVETVAMGEPDASGKILSGLKALGVRLCIDDFGIGYSSLSRLQNLPVHGLKIDRSFIQQIEIDKTKQDVVRTIVQLAHAVGLRVVAEGIETRSQALLVRELGCELAQGYYFSRPESADQIRKLIAKRHLGFDSDSAAAEA